MLYLDGMRAGGREQQLSWGRFRYLVVVEEFECTFERNYQLFYKIRCRVVSNGTDPATDPGNASIDDQVNADMLDVKGLILAALNNPILLTPFGALQAAMGTALSAASSFALASPSIINSVLAPLGALQAAVGAMQATAQLALAGVGAIGALAGTAGAVGAVGAVAAGVSGVSGVAGAVAGINAAIGATAQLAALGQVSGLLGRIAGNLGAVVGSQAAVVTAGGNLFQLASATYGQVSGWTAIARANGMADPKISGVQTLTVPASPGNTGGVLSQ
jgi:hypothetical protein